MSRSGVLSRGQHAPHTCPACRLPLVQPEAWAPVGRGWRLLLHCPSCGWESEEVLDEPAVQRYDDELDKGFEQLVAALAQLTAVNMRDYSARFGAALRADAILPEDF